MIHLNTGEVYSNNNVFFFWYNISVTNQLFLVPSGPTHAFSVDIPQHCFKQGLKSSKGNKMESHNIPGRIDAMNREYKHKEHIYFLKADVQSHIDNDTALPISI